MRSDSVVRRGAPGVLPGRLLGEERSSRAALVREDDFASLQERPAERRVLQKRQRIGNDPGPPWSRTAVGRATTSSSRMRSQ
jgi:hypothetical protein